MKTLTRVEDAEMARANYLERNWQAYSNHRHPDHKIVTYEAQVLADNILRLKGIDPNSGVGPDHPRAPL